MNKTTIQTLIDKVIGKKGLIRVPSWWMRKVLMQMADWVQEGDDANGEKIVKVKEEADAKIVKVKEEADGKINTLDNNMKTALIELKKSLHTQKCFIIKTGANAGYVVVDGNKEDIPANTQRIVTYNYSFSFYDKLANPNLTFIGLAVANTSTLTTMSSMFYKCSGLKSLDLTGLNTSAVTSMASMFYECSGLTSLDLTGLDTSAVTTMEYMFGYCSVHSLDLSSFNTSAVTNMSYMFGYCSVRSLDLSSFDTSAVTNMSYMFGYCYDLTSLLLGPNFFKTPSVTSVDFSSSTEWINDTVVTSLVTNSYDRATAGLKTMTLQLSANTKAALTDEQKAAITAKGYTIA